MQIQKLTKPWMADAIICAKTLKAKLPKMNIIEHSTIQ